MKAHIQKETNYKGHTITLFHDVLGQVLVMIDRKQYNGLRVENKNLFASVQDAKRFINGEQPKYMILGGSVTGYEFE